MSKSEPVKHFFQCDCCMEGLVFEYDSEYKEVSLALWQYGGYSEKLDWKNRIRWCWNILRKGLPWVDQIMMKPKEARQLAQSILDNVKEEE
jgi:hypothetical protein